MCPSFQKEFKLQEMDNRILNTAYWFEKKKQNVVMVTKDINFRIKAEAIGLESQDYKFGKVKMDDIYSGITELDVPAKSIDKFYKRERNFH